MDELVDYFISPEMEIAYYWVADFNFPLSPTR